MESSSFWHHRKEQVKIKGNRVFATTTSWVMVKNQPVIHSSIGTVMRLAIRKHAQKSRRNNKASSAKQDQSAHKVTKANQIYTNTKL